MQHNSINLEFLMVIVVFIVLFLLAFTSSVNPQWITRLLLSTTSRANRSVIKKISKDNFDELDSDTQRRAIRTVRLTGIFGLVFFAMIALIVLYSIVRMMS